MIADVETELAVSETKQADHIVLWRDFLRYRSHRRKVWEPFAEKGAKFWFGDQWSQEDKYSLISQKRAPSVFNMVLPAVDLIVGHQIQNRVDFVASPVDKYADPEIADILTSAIKHVENHSNATFERRWQFLDGVITGIGVCENWYDDTQDIEGEIKITQGSGWHYYLDPNFEKYDYSDGRKVFKEMWMDHDQIKRIYGKKIADKISVPTKDEISNLKEEEAKGNWTANPTTDYGNRADGGYNDGTYEDTLYGMGYDRKNERVRVIEEYEKIWDEVKIYGTLEGGVFRKDELTDEELEDASLIKTMQVPHIHLRTLIADHEIGEDKDLPNKEFSELFNFYFPYFYNGRYMGVIKNVEYPQEEINKVHSSIMNILNTMARSGMHYKEGAMNAEYEADIENLLGQPSPIIKWDELYDEHGRPNYIRDTPHDMPNAFFQIMAGEGANVKYITGANDAIQGIAQRAESGRAKMSDVTQSTVRLTGIIENFRETQKLAGKAHIWWIQNYYTEERFIRIRGDENGNGGGEQIILNQQIYGQIANDITIGQFDIVLKMEGKTQTERERLFWKYVEMAKTLGPEYAPVFARLALQSSDVPEKEEVIAEIRQIQQAQMQMQQGGAVQNMRGQGQTGQPRGAIQSAPKPSRGRREPPHIGQPAASPYSQ